MAEEEGKMKAAAAKTIIKTPLPDANSKHKNRGLLIRHSDFYCVAKCSPIITADLINPRLFWA